MHPYHKNFKKRLVKSPKLYFYDTGLACSLLGIRDESQVNAHFLKGALFENLIINEFLKHDFNRGLRRYPFFWQDSRAYEIDCLLVDGEEIMPVEIKSGKTISTSYFDHLTYWRHLSGQREDQGHVVYGGEKSITTGKGELVNWKELERILPLEKK